MGKCQKTLIAKHLDAFTSEWILVVFFWEI